MAPPADAVGHAWNRQVPRAPLPDTSVTRASVVQAPPRRALPLLHRSYGLMRQTSSLLRNLCIHTYFRRSLQVAASPCWELVPDVISSKSFPGCPSPDPVGLQGATACFFPCIIGLPQVL